MRESEYTRTVTKLLPRAVYALKLSTSYTAGVPDSWYSGSRADLWVEWKYFKVLPLAMDLCGGKTPVLTRLQQDWLKGRHAEGRHVAVIVGCTHGAVIYPRLSWQRVLSRAEFILRCAPKAEVARWITEQCVSMYEASEVLPVAESIALDPQPQGP